jgi:hypothetical protein
MVTPELIAAVTAAVAERDAHPEGAELAPTRFFLMARAPQPVAPAKITVQLGAHGWTARDGNVTGRIRGHACPVKVVPFATRRQQGPRSHAPPNPRTPPAAPEAPDSVSRRPHPRRHAARGSIRGARERLMRPVPETTTGRRSNSRRPVSPAKEVVNVALTRQDQSTPPA